MDRNAFHKLLAFGVERGVSDIHFEVGYPPHYRLHGELLGAIKVPPLTASDTEAIARMILEDRSITIDFTRRFAEIDVSLVEQALTNLIVNAIQAMPKGGTLTVRSCEEVVSPPAGVTAGAGRYGALHVEDTGVGMSSEQLRHAFEPFFTTKDVGIGTGLGLSVAHGIIRDHNGWIAATSAIDQGSRFSIYLPLTQTTEQPNG